MNDLASEQPIPCPEGWGIEELMWEAYRGGTHYGLPDVFVESSKAGELSDLQRLEMIFALREVNKRFDRDRQRLRDYGAVGAGIAGDLLDYSGQVALLRRGLELGLAEEGTDLQNAISGAHEAIGQKVLQAFDKCDIATFQEIISVMKARDSDRAIRELKSKRKSGTGGRTLKGYNLEVAFPMALRKVVARRSRYLVMENEEGEFTRRPIGWEELRDAVCAAQREFGGEAFGIRFDEISSRVKKAGFTAFMESTPRDKKNWKPTG